MTTQTKIKLTGFDDDNIEPKIEPQRVHNLVEQVMAEQVAHEKTKRRMARLEQRIESRDADHNYDQEMIRSLTHRAESAEQTLESVRETAAGFERGWHRATAEVTELQNKLAAAQLNEAAALARLNDGDSWGKRWEAEWVQQRKDYEALEGQLSDVRCRLVEARAEIRSMTNRRLGLKFWGR